MLAIFFSSIYWDMSMWIWNLLLYFVGFIKICFGSMSKRHFYCVLQRIYFAKNSKPVSISNHEYVLAIEMFLTKVHVWWQTSKPDHEPKPGYVLFLCFLHFCLLCLKIYIVGKILVEPAMGLGLSFLRPLVCEEVVGTHRWIFQMNHRGRANRFGENFLKAICAKIMQVVVMIHI